MYNAALLVSLVAGSPYWLFRIATARKYREGLWHRLGAVPRGLQSAAKGRRLVWLHAVSVGEVLAVSRLVKELDAHAHGFRVVISTTTRTGQKLARERFGAERCFYFPLDLSWATGRYLRMLRPVLLVLAESEFWPNLLSGCRKRGVPVVVVNGRISDRSLPRYLRLRHLWRPFLAAITRVLAQSETDAQRFAAIGIAASRIEIGGNLKYEVRVAEKNLVTERLRAHLPERARVLVCGSTVQGEEEMLLDAWAGLTRRLGSIVMVLAPRHPERFNAVADLLHKRSVFVRRSAWMEAPAQLPPASIFLLDSIGELATVYSLGNVAFVGGSLVPAGGHNPLEPAQFGVPVIMGPHYENFRGIVDVLREHDAITVTGRDGLSPTLIALLASPEEAARMGARAKTVFEQEAGATARTIAALLQVLASREVQP